jgi:hypothetical protein
VPLGQFGAAGRALFGSLAKVHNGLVAGPWGLGYENENFRRDRIECERALQYAVKSLRAAMPHFLWRLKHYLGYIVGAIGFVLSLLAGFKLIDYYFADQNLKGLIASWYVLGLLTLIILFACGRTYQTIRKERYANITPYFHQAFHALRNIESFLELRKPVANASDNEHEQYISHLRTMFRDVLDQINLAFVSLTSTYCRTSIKLTYEIGGQLYFYTLARDSGSEQKLRELDRRRVRENHDPLDSNRQFARLFSPDEECWHFVSNDLRKERDFSTTSMTAYDPNYRQRVDRAGIVERLFGERSPLPYKSTIACAIRQGTFDRADDVPQVVLGFLTVDSESRGVFTERWDVQIVFAFADALFHPLKRFVMAQTAAEAAGVSFV